MQCVQNFGRAVAMALTLSASLAQSETVPNAVELSTGSKPGVALELNTADMVGEACRLTFVVTNGTAAQIERSVYETVLFSKEGQVVLLTLFDFGSLPVGVPRVRQFQIPDTGCADLSSLLINGANACTVAGQDSDLCAKGLATSSRTTIKLQG